MAGCETTAVRDTPCDGQGALFVFSEVPQTEQGCAIVLRIKVGDTVWIPWVFPVWIR